MRTWWLGLALTACDGGDVVEDDTDVVPSDPVEIRFRGAVGEEDFACGASYTDIGASKSTYVAGDLRFYIHDLTLVDDAGEEVAVDLDQDDTWQYRNLALVDLEDGDGCEAGTPGMHATVGGTVPQGHTWTGLRFGLGVPADLNHLDPTTAPAPLDVSSMFWVWLSGRKHLRLDGEVAESEASWLLHLGATGCDGANPQGPPTGACANPNLGAVQFDAFDLANDTIVADIASLFATSDLTTNDMDPGCMSSPDDDECAVLLPRLGVTFGDTPGEQGLFRVE